MAELIKIQVNCIKENDRLILCFDDKGEETGAHECCVHGIKLRWTCEDCDYHFGVGDFAEEEDDDL